MIILHYMFFCDLDQTADMQVFGEDCALRVVALKILFRPEEKDVQMAFSDLLHYHFIAHYLWFVLGEC